MKHFEFYSEALTEFREASEYFEQQVTGLGGKFRQEIDDAIQFIRQFPESGRLNAKTGTRSRATNRFRYVIHYQDLPDKVIIFAVAHGRRRPGYWRRRLG